MAFPKIGMCHSSLSHLCPLRTSVEYLPQGLTLVLPEDKCLTLTPLLLPPFFYLIPPILDQKDPSSYQYIVTLQKSLLTPIPSHISIDQPLSFASIIMEYNQAFEATSWAHIQSRNNQIIAGIVVFLVNHFVHRFSFIILILRCLSLMACLVVFFVISIV